MKIKILVCVCAIFLIVACGNDTKKGNFAISDKTDVTSETTQAKEKETTSNIEKTLSFDEKIKMIKSNFLMIEKQLSSLEKKEKDENVGGGVIKREGYFKAGVPQKVKLGNHGEHGAEVHTFYLLDNKLFFVLKEEFSEASMRGPFTKNEKRFYIYDDQLIRVLEKEKTVTSGEIDTSDARNVDVTDHWKSTSNVVSDFEKILREASVSLISVKSVSLDNGRWISKNDPNAGIEIKDGKFIMFYKSETISSNDVYEYTLSEHEGVEYLTLIDETGDKLEYSILEYTDEIFMLSYLVRGNRLTYEKAN